METFFVEIIILISFTQEGERNWLLMQQSVIKKNA